jgi:hypothetical protein
VVVLVARRQRQNHARTLLGILRRDRPRLERIDRYLHGKHDDPYMPALADAEYKLLAKRAVSNWLPLIVSTPAQMLYVDSVRRVRSSTDPDRAATAEPAEVEWSHWERSGLDARQLPVHRGALSYGHSFVVTEQSAQDGKWRTRGLSPLRTAAIYDDPASDIVPIAAMTVVKWPSADAPGQARMWDSAFRSDLTFAAPWDAQSLKVISRVRHGAPECPVTRFAAAVDLEGRTLGVVEPVMVLQDKINQTVFDLLVAQTYSSTQVRWISGMAPPVKRNPETGEPILDANGNKIPLPINVNTRRLMIAEGSDVKFGSLPPSPLNGLIDSIELSVRHLAAVSQTPPHHILGTIANLSSEALMAAETALLRKVTEFQSAFAGSWERVFRLVARIEGDEPADVEDFTREVVWRDMESRALAANADGLGKLAESLDIPKRGLWTRVPGVTDAEIRYWDQLASDADYEGRMASLMLAASGDDFGQQTTTAPAVADG